ncbi:MAG: hypothetical protein EBX52_02720 [Proteobacteria bacterium]|nr:hypothetical protein [Pseudomonadota bacterium]
MISIAASSAAQAERRGQTVMSYEGPKKEETLYDQRWGLTPSLGILGYTDNSGAATSRVTLGVAFDWNLENLIRSEAPRNQYVGISTGFLYSHPGASDANFFGSSSSTGSDSNLFLIPIDLKIGYALNDTIRLSVRGGGSLIYRSNASASDLGAGSNSGSDLWKIYPNVGVDADIQLAKNLMLTVRPDLTLTPGNDLYVATVGATYVGF